MQIRAAQAEDYEQMLKLYEELHTFHVVGIPNYFKPFEPEMYNLEFFTEWLQNPAKYLFVAEEAGELLGYLYSEVKDLPENSIRYSQRFIEVEELGVTEASRSRGVGEQLYK